MKIGGVPPPFPPTSIILTGKMLLATSFLILLAGSAAELRFVKGPNAATCKGGEGIVHWDIGVAGERVRAGAVIQSDVRSKSVLEIPGLDIAIPWTSRMMNEPPWKSLNGTRIQWKSRAMRLLVKGGEGGFDIYLDSTKISCRRNCRNAILKLSRYGTKAVAELGGVKTRFTVGDSVTLRSDQPVLAKLLTVDLLDGVDQEILVDVRSDFCINYLRTSSDSNVLRIHYAGLVYTGKDFGKWSALRMRHAVIGTSIMRVEAFKDEEEFEDSGEELPDLFVSSSLACEEDSVESSSQTVVRCETSTLKTLPAPIDCGCASCTAEKCDCGCTMTTGVITQSTTTHIPPRMSTTTSSVSTITSTPTPITPPPTERPIPSRTDVPATTSPTPTTQSPLTTPTRPSTRSPTTTIASSSTALSTMGILEPTTRPTSPAPTATNHIATTTPTTTSPATTAASSITPLTATPPDTAQAVDLLINERNVDSIPLENLDPSMQMSITPTPTAFPSTTTRLTFLEKLQQVETQKGKAAVKKIIDSETRSTMTTPRQQRVPPQVSIVSEGGGIEFWSSPPPAWKGTNATIVIQNGEIPSPLPDDPLAQTETSNTLVYVLGGVALVLFAIIVVYCGFKKLECRVRRGGVEDNQVAVRLAVRMEELEGAHRAAMRLFREREMREIDAAYDELNNTDVTMESGVGVLHPSNTGTPAGVISAAADEVEPVADEPLPSAPTTPTSSGEGSKRVSKKGKMLPKSSIALRSGKEI